jgi:Cellulase (glycosyl hydrolase family 5)
MSPRLDDPYPCNDDASLSLSTSVGKEDTMRRPTWLTAVTIATLMFCIVGVGQAVTASGHPRVTRSTGPFMRVCGLQFCIGGKAFYPYGATFYQSTGQAGISQSQHLNTIRLANFLDHDGDPATAPYDPTAWAEVDTFIATARSANIKILLDLSDYGAELWNSCTNPYTASWVKYLSFVAHRMNTVTGARYKADPEIVMVSFTGEPLPVGSHTFTDSTGGSCTITDTTAELTHFYAQVEGKWRSLDRHHLRVAGGLSNVDLPNSGIDWQAIFGNKANSVCAWKTYGGMINWLPTGAQYCRNVLHKPWFNDEWGYTQAMGDSARASSFSNQFANNSANGGAGNFYWNANYLVSPTTYDVGPGTPLTQAAVVSNAP